MITLRGVSKTVQSGGRPLTILHPLDLEVADGKCLAIIGPSGSGKSTLLGLIAGLDAASSGSIQIAGTDITTLDEDALARLRGDVFAIILVSENHPDHVISIADSVRRALSTPVRFSDRDIALFASILILAALPWLDRASSPIKYFRITSRGTTCPLAA